MTRTAGAPIGCQRPSRFWGLGCPKIYHEVEDTLDTFGISATCASGVVHEVQAVGTDRGNRIPVSRSGEADVLGYGG